MKSARAAFAHAIFGVALFSLFLSSSAPGQNAVQFNSHEVHANGSITFRYLDPSASTVLVHLDGVDKPLALEKGRDGIWSVVTAPLSPEIYGYGFEVDGRSQLDPRNSAVTPNLVWQGNSVAVSGSVPRPWEARDVSHGVVHHHFYTSKVVKGLTEGQSEYFVYTPPAYRPKKGQPYPVLYLMHGWSDMANGWTAVGHANDILDNLIAEGKITPMIVVMPLGYGDMSFVVGGEGGWSDEAAIDRNGSLFSQALLTEIMPQVESEYHVSRKADQRAITGLSMGGLESLTIGLGHPELFGWVGAFSAALGHHEQQQLTSLHGKAASPHLLWIACGTEDDLISPNRSFVAWLKSKEVPVTAVETPGMHNWLVWRDNLEHFTPLLFRK